VIDEMLASDVLDEEGWDNFQPIVASRLMGNPVASAARRLQPRETIRPTIC
jgi:hypothetical protein